MAPREAAAGVEVGAGAEPCALDARSRERQTPGMGVQITVEHSIRAPAESVFALSLDPERFPLAFRGFGPIPSIRSITLHQALAPGSTRRLANSDGSQPLERIIALDPPHRHAYILSGLSPPFSWLVREGQAEWTFVAVPEGTRVTWRYRFVLTAAVAWPLAWPLLQVFMRRAMQQCLQAMAQMLESGGAQRRD